ncbi:MAG: Clp protease N-terminal domain-containing protein [Gemmatimonadaceae bacterium]
MPATIALPFTSRTYVALAIARGIAAGLGHTDVSATHIALGILREGENIAVVTLHDGGVNLRQLRHELESGLPPHGHPQLRAVVLPTTKTEQEIVELAATEAAALDSEYLGCEHLLLALLRDPDAAIARTFAGQGFTYDVAITRLIAFYRKSREE